MNHLHAILFLSLLTASISCESAFAQPSNAEAHQERPSAADASPLSGFAIMEDGQWKLGSIHADTWRWGPGRHSIRSLTVGADGEGKPWREMAVYYWHPGLGQIRALSLHPDIPGIGRGVAEGSVEFDGQTLTGTVDLYQTGRPKPVHRRLAHRWTFDGPDRYQEALLEDSGRGYTTLAEWDYARSLELAPAPAHPVGDSPVPSANLEPLLPLLGAWEERLGDIGSANHSRLRVEWAELLDLITGQLDVSNPEQGPVHLIDVYLYHHIRTNALRCLALMRSGGVYEGEVTLLPGGSLQSDLRGYEGDREIRHIARLDVEEDGALRERLWIVDGADRRLIHDVRRDRVASDRE